MSEISILIVDDEPLIASDIADICKSAGYQVVDIAMSVGQALDNLKNKNIDLILLDINLQDAEADGIDLAKHIVQHSNLPFLFLTSYADKATLDRAKKTNPLGYIVKPFNSNQLISTIEIALHNYSIQQVPKGLDRAILNKALHSPLTEREWSILNHIFQGRSNSQLAEQEFISINTVKYHIKQLYSKFQVQNRSTLFYKIREIMSQAV